MKNYSFSSYSGGLLRFFTAGLAGLSVLLLAVSFQSCKKSDVKPSSVKDTTVVKQPSPPAITNFSPVKGLVGTTIVITGTNFDTIPVHNTVTFNGTAATVTQASVTQLTVTVPQGAASGKISITVNSLTAASSTDFIVNKPLTLSTAEGIMRQLIYLTGGSGFGTIPDHNGFALYSNVGVATYADVLGYTGDSLVLLVPYVVPGVYTDSARVDGVTVSLGTFKVDTPSLTKLIVVSNITPATGPKGTAATITVGNGSTAPGSTTVALIALYQNTGTPVALNCNVSSLTAGSFGSTVISFVIPDGVTAGISYAAKVTVNSAVSYGGLNANFIGQ